MAGLRKLQGTFCIPLSAAKKAQKLPYHSLTKQFLFQVRDNFTSATNGVVLALRQAIVPRRESGKLDQLLLKRLEQIGDKVRIGMCVEFCIYCFQ